MVNRPIAKNAIMPITCSAPPSCAPVSASLIKAGKRDTMPAKIITEMPLPIPRS
jgi:hypothetical protein